MTSRLKRKLGELGVDTSSAKANENFCLIGTPLPPLEKSKDIGEFVPLWKQDVRDEQGRRRLHGAFTGGWSAGYYNTVGSREGFTPSTFVSSRSDRAKLKAARPEDFMDEEDLAELRENQTIVDTTEQMDLFCGTPAELRMLEDAGKDPVTLALQSAMLPPPSDSAGARILKKMGWRPGQGIGPRITYRQRKAQDLELGVSMEDQEGEDSEMSKHMYAPRDHPILLVERKENAQGLGYTPDLNLQQSLGRAGTPSAMSGPSLAAGFGLGALNDADEDDVDVYDGDVRHGRSRTAYDGFEGEEDTIRIGNKLHATVAKPENRASSSGAPTFSTRFDGQPVLPGFVPSHDPVSADLLFPFPDVPKGWTPNPKRVWEKYNLDASKSSSSSQPVSHAEWKAGVSADERGAILGETPLPSAPRSVFEYMSQKDRERLQKFAMAVTQSPSTTPANAQPNLEERSSSVIVPHTEAHVAEAALRGWQPFTAEPDKQARYTAYLQSQASPSASQELLRRKLGQSISDFNKELSEYAKSALLFRPISGFMGGKFATATSVEKEPMRGGGLRFITADDELEAAEETSKEPEKIEETSPKAHAAKLGMYGPMTREVTKWHPARLLCKRFGVKDPNPEPDQENAPISTSVSIPAWTAGSAVAADELAKCIGAPITPTDGGKGPRDLTNIGLGEDDDQGHDTLTYKRPAMDVFKAIFASDDEESADEADGQAAPTEEGVDVGSLRVDPVPPSTTGAISPAPLRGSDAAATSEKVNASTTFKPTFIPRQDKKQKDKDKDKGKDKEDRKDKKKKTSKLKLVSFELDEVGYSFPQDDKPKKKRKETRSKAANDTDESVWVEKPPPEVVGALPRDALSVSAAEDYDSEVIGPPRGRKRAIDFM